jgi:hypothetical protein
LRPALDALLNSLPPGCAAGQGNVAAFAAKNVRQSSDRYCRVVANVDE